MLKVPQGAILLFGTIIPLTRAEARAYIASARSKRGINSDGTYDATDLNLADIIGALKLTATQLYPDIFHFIWEILQNADDAIYDTALRPELKLILTDSTLYAWSNQCSFTQSDVDALCAIGRSSKALDPNTIGEKGIGFKSLFKVADKVTVHSDPWHFKLDTSSPLGPLGMIVPMWTEEPAGVRSNDFTIPADGTTLALHLKPNIRLASLQKQLAGFDFSFLLFARRLKCLAIFSHCRNHEYGKSAVVFDGSDDKVTLVITDQVGNGPLEMHKFSTASHEVQNMPNETARSGQTSSVVKLAFPVGDWSKPLPTRSIYAFLPIKDFGFRFLIHADFILTANRGDVEHDHPWNIRLREGLCDGIQQKLYDLARNNSSTRLHWPRYVGNLRDIYDPFFQILARKVYDYLTKTHVVQIEYRSGQGTNWFALPKTTAFVASEFRFDGTLIIDSDSMHNKAVIEGYSENSKRALKELGVGQFSHENFLNELDSWISDNANSFQQKPEQWHISLAHVLLNFPRFQSSARFRCQSLQIIPLANGHWVSAARSNIFLPDNQIHEIPSGLTVDFVSLTACRDPTRRHLFESLGVSVCDKRKICELILENEGNGRKSTVKALLEQAKFLFLSNHRAKTYQTFRFHNSEGHYGGRSHPMLVPFGKRGKELRQLFAKDFGQVKWLNSAYEELVHTDDLERFVNWLVEWDTILPWPPLEAFGDLSGECKHIFERNGSKTALFHLLQRRTAGGSLPINNIRWCQRMAELNVATNNGIAGNVTVPMSQTVLPRLQNAGDGLVSVLDLHCPNDPNWNFLSHFGVSINVDTNFVLRKLRSLSKEPSSNSTKATASKIYIQLGELCKSDEDLRKTFNSEDLVYIPGTGWVNISTCRISAAFEMTRFPVLSKLYPSCSKLFKSILRTKVADLEDLIKELMSLSSKLAHEELPGDKTKLVYQQLRALDKMLATDTVVPQQIDRLKDIPIFPISFESNSEKASSLYLRKSSDSFWIADISVLLKLFGGKIKLLASDDGRPLDFLDKVFETLDMDDKRLTRCAEKEPDLGQDFFPDDMMTRSLRQKVPYILSVLKKSIESQALFESSESQLGNLQVLRVGQFKLKRFVRDAQGVKCYGKDDEGDGWLAGGAKEMTIYLKESVYETDCHNILMDYFMSNFGISMDYWRLLYKVMSTTSPERCLEDLQRAGISDPEVNQAHPHLPTPISDDQGSHTPEDELQNALQGLTINAPTPSEFQNNTPSDSTRVVHRSHNPHPVTQISHLSTPFTPIHSVRSAPSTSQQPRASESPSLDASVPRPSRTFITAAATNDLAERLSTVSLTDMTPPHNQMPVVSERQTQIFIRSDNSGPGSPPERVESTSNRTFDQDPGARSETLVASQISETPSRANNSADLSSSLLAGARRTFEEASRGFSFSFSRPHVNLTLASSTATSRGCFGELVHIEPENYFPHEIGRAGERLVFDHLSRKLGSTVDPFCWTSRNRNAYFENHFEGLEKNFADFTYKDTGGKMKDYLRGIIPNFGEGETTSETTYHLEVKTTMEGLDTNVHLSNNQIQMARRYSRWLSHSGATSTNLYVLVRVYDLATTDPPEPKLCLFPDPWSLMCCGKLSIEAEGGFLVRPERTES